MIQLNVDWPHCKHNMLDQNHVVKGHHYARELETELNSFYKICSTSF